MSFLKSVESFALKHKSRARFGSGLMAEIERVAAEGLELLRLTGTGAAGDEARSKDHGEEGNGNNNIMHCVVLLVEA